MLVDEEHEARQQHYMQTLFFVLGFVLLAFGIQMFNDYTTAHIKAVDSLCTQIAHNTNVPLEEALAASITLASQAGGAFTQMGYTNMLHLLKPTMQALLRQHSRFGAESVQFGSTSGAMVMVRNVEGAKGGLAHATS